MDIRRFYEQKPIALSDQIKRTIGNRIILCFTLIMLVLFSLTFYDALSSVNQLKQNLDTQCKTLGSYTISQLLINNQDAIQLKLDRLNKANPAIQFSWVTDNQKLLSDGKLHWVLPFSWQYFYPLNNSEGNFFGGFIIKGSFLYDQELLSELLTKITLLFFFLAMIFIILNPLSKRIPQRLFIKPINNLLSLLRNDKNAGDLENTTTLPDEINEIRTKIMDLLKDAEARSREAALGQIATQVAHDIRSPLLVLKRVLSDLSSLPEKQRINARNAIQRVTDIANNLLTQYKHEKNDMNSETALSSEPAAMMLESIVSEKRVQVADLGVEVTLDIAPNAYDAFIQVDIAGFKRVLSNLMNNAIDAVKEKRGAVTLTLKKIDNQVFIDIRDNGCGIPRDKLRTVLEEGATFGKKEGSGLGLPYAVSKIAEWHGDYSLQSRPGEGTQFEIVLPEVKPAEWFRGEITIEKGGTIVVLDDDDYIHQIWDERFPKSFLQTDGLTLLHFNNPPDFIQFCQGKVFEKATFLMDYELEKYKETGLDLAEMLNLGPHATLVTSRYEDVEVRERCKALGMKIIPKYFAELTPIRISIPITPTEIVFVDDEEVIGEFWKDSAEAAGKSISVFKDPRDFMQVVHQYPKDVLIYMDSSLGNGLKGEDFAKQLYDQGYQNIILATGFSKDHFKNVTWVKDIIGKEPPWG